MNPRHTPATNRLVLVAFAAALIGAAAAVTPGAAEARDRVTTVTGAQGKTATRKVSRVKGDVQSSTTGPNGKTMSRTVDRSADGTTATVTGPNGQTATRTTTVTP